jgi:hypothetical protein
LKLSSISIVTIAILFSHNAYTGDLGKPQVVEQPVIEFVPEGTILPMLEVKFDCGDCKQDRKIKLLIEGAYLDKANLEKAQIDELQPTYLNISKYRNRGKARFFVGALAGADNITSTIECNGLATEVSDTAISALNGIESVAENVGEDAYKIIKTCVLGLSSKLEQKEIPIENQDTISQ